VTSSSKTRQGFMNEIWKVPFMGLFYAGFCSLRDYIPMFSKIKPRKTTYYGFESEEEYKEHIWRTL